MLTNEELDSLSIGGLGFCGPESFERLIAQAKEANKLREQLATARRDALEEAAKVCGLEADACNYESAAKAKQRYPILATNFANSAITAEKLDKAIRALKEKA